MYFARLADRPQSILSGVGYKNAGEAASKLRLVCTECGDAVFARYLKDKNNPGTGQYYFAHKHVKTDNPEQTTCVLRNVTDPTFAAAIAAASGAGEADQVRAVLMRDKVMPFNVSLLRSLYQRTTDRELPQSDAEKWVMRAIHDWMNCALFYARPYLLPYAAIEAGAPYERRTLSGSIKPVSWKGNDRDYHLYERADGTFHQAVLPRSWKLQYEVEPGRNVILTDEEPLYIGLAAAKRLTKITFLDGLPRVPETDRAALPEPEKKPVRTIKTDRSLFVAPPKQLCLPGFKG